MDTTLLHWQISKWVLANIFDIAFWLVIVCYFLNNILENVPTAKADTTFQALCNVVNGLNAGVRNFITKKGEINEKPIKKPGTPDSP